MPSTCSDDGKTVLAASSVAATVDGDCIPHVGWIALGEEIETE
jgi:hypothetical protein